VIAEGLIMVLLLQWSSQSASGADVNKMRRTMWGNNNAKR